MKLIVLGLSLFIIIVSVKLIAVHNSANNLRRMNNLKKGEAIFDLKLWSHDLEIPYSLEFGTGSTSPSKYLLMITSPNCPFCDQNMISWKSMVRDMKNSSDLVPLYISTFSDRSLLNKYPEYLALANLYSAINPDRMARILKLSSVPSTILVSYDGRVLYTDVGLLTDRDASVLKNAISNYE